MLDALASLLASRGMLDRALVEVTDESVADALRSRDPAVRLAVWAPDNSGIDAALAYPHYERVHTRPARASRSDDVHGAGKAIFVTAQNAEDWDSVSAAGIDGVITDYPARLLGLLEAGGP